MLNKTTKTKTILFASLIAAMILPFSMADPAYADPSDKIQKLMDNYVKVEANLEKAKEAGNEQRVEKLEKRLDVILDKLNDLDVYHTSQEVDKEVAETHAEATTNSCCEDKTIKFKAGTYYMWQGFWKVVNLADNFTYVAQGGSGESEVVVQDGVEGTQPYMLVQPGSGHPRNAVLPAVMTVYPDAESLEIIHDGNNAANPDVYIGFPWYSAEADVGSSYTAATGNLVKILIQSATLS